jgi:hypothetical protein
MHNSSLIKLLQIFSKKEIHELKEFLASPFFNKRKSVIKLFEIIIKYHPGFHSEAILKEKVFSKLFPDKKYNDNSLRVVTHYLTELVKEYLTYSRIKKDNLEFLIQTGKELLEKKQFIMLEKNIMNTASKLESADLEASEYFFFRYRLENEKMDYVHEASSGVMEKFMDKTNPEKVFEELTNFYIVKSMKIYLNMLTIEEMYNRDFKLEAFRNVISGINIDEYKDFPGINLYYNLIKMKTDSNDESHFFKVEEIVKLKKNKISTSDTVGAYVNLTNYCTKKILEGKNEFENQKFEIYKEELVKKTYKMSDGFMSPVFFRNIVFSALILKEYEWVKQFMIKYKTELHKEYRENYYLFCMAHYEFNIKNFESALELNSRIKYDELYLKLNSRLLQIQLLYELELEEPLISALESFRHFISNNKLIPEKRRILFSNFYKYLNSVLKFRNKNDKSSLSFLKSKIAGNKNILNKDWLLNKIDEIMQNLKN